jgi:hypothetical protein
MDLELLLELTEKVRKGKFPVHHELFSNAEITVATSVKQETSKQLIISEYAPQISWLIVELQKVLEEELIRAARHDFYCKLATAANKAILEKKDIFDILEQIILQAEAWAKECSKGILDVR